MDSVSLGRSYAKVRKKDPAVLRWLRFARIACLGAGQRPTQALSIEVANPRAAQEQVQAVCTDDNKARHACLKSKSTEMHSDSALLCAFRGCWGHCFTLIAELSSAEQGTLD